MLCFIFTMGRDIPLPPNLTQQGSLAPTWLDLSSCWLVDGRAQLGGLNQRTWKQCGPAAVPCAVPSPWHKKGGNVIYCLDWYEMMDCSDLPLAAGRVPWISACIALITFHFSVIKCGRTGLYSFAGGNQLNERPGIGCTIQ